MTVLRDEGKVRDYRNFARKWPAEIFRLSEYFSAKRYSIVLDQVPGPLATRGRDLQKHAF